MAEVVRQDRLKRGLEQFHKKCPIPAHAMRYKKNFQRALGRAKVRLMQKRWEDEYEKVDETHRIEANAKLKANRFRDEYGKKTFFGILRNESKLFKHRFQKYGALSFQAIKEAAARNNSRERKIANNVFDERHQEMMLIKDIGNAQGSDPAAFFPAARMLMLLHNEKKLKL